MRNKNYKKLIAIGGNVKTDKNVKYGYLTGILYLSPSNEAKKKGYNIKNLCPYASKGCKKACLYSAGRGKFSNVQEARIKKTVYIMEGKKFDDIPDKHVLESMIKDINILINKAKKLNLKPSIRLNGTSDLPVHTWGLMEKYPQVKFYDYTKDINKMLLYLEGKLPKNYHLTFSYTEKNILLCLDVLYKDGNVAMVFKDKLPKTFLGYNVINGDNHDLTFLHDKKCIIGLKAKGDAKKDNSGFVINPNYKMMYV